MQRSTGPDSTRFVGRDAELRRVTDALRRRPALVLVEGEAGIGKSRLVREALADVAPERPRPLVAVCPPYREALTLGPIVDAARQAAPSSADIADLGLSALAGTLRPLFPEWAEGLPPAPEPPADAGSARHRLIRAFAELLGRLGTGILVVEDVHWADEATLELLLFLASQRPQPLSLVLTYRPEEVAADSLLLRLSSRGPTGAGTSRVRVDLGGLAVADTAELVSSVLDDEQVSAAFAAFLHERTAGVPLVLEECIRLMRDRADIVRRDGEWVRRTLGEIAVPPTIRDAVTERVARLGADAQRVLLAAAVLSDPADERMLGAVGGLAEGASPVLDPVVAAAVSDALVSGLLIEDGSGPGRIAFRHALAARAVYDRVPPSERRAAHRRAAVLLETARPRQIGRLAHHFREAGETARWCEYTEQAADVALASGDHLTAVTLLHELITEPLLPAEAVAPLVRKMPFLAFTDYARRAEAVTALRAVLETDRLGARDRADVRGQLGRVLFSLGDYTAAAVELELAVPDLREGSFVDAWAMTALGLPWVGPWPAATHLHWLDRAERFVAGSGLAPHERLCLLVNRTTALLELGEESGWTLAEELGDDESTPQIALERARAELNVGDAAMRWGRYAEARVRLTRAVDVAGRHDLQVLRIMSLVTLLRLDYLTGARQGLAERADHWADTADVPVCRLEARLLGAQLRLAAAESGEELEELLRTISEEGERRGIIALWLESAAAHARLRLSAGDAEEALALTEDSVRLITGKSMWVWATETASVRVAALAAAGRLTEAEQFVAAFGEGILGRDAPAARSALEECRALCVEARGEFEAAARAWGEAARAWSQLPRPHEEALAREAAERCTRAARGVWRGGRRGYGSRLSPRELEVVRLVLQGKTNRQIAQELSRSPSTVAAQLKSAMRKHGVTSRTALAVSVTQAGLD
ncbi:helix-turn-helix transcriptional regulator [Streptacidiphilus griseoplanus]|uniref:helix-turn-helix transcriptional regulator n=1 Tax=Peterkaempfera griseoplana TaxID=66896 RepID=UPI0006E2EEAF|nr:LuxR family transcriptional regulator [Peterkaempfera griseoplana]